MPDPIPTETTPSHATEPILSPRPGVGLGGWGHHPGRGLMGVRRWVEPPTRAGVARGREGGGPPVVGCGLLSSGRLRYSEIRLSDASGQSGHQVQTHNPNIPAINCRSSLGGSSTLKYNGRGHTMPPLYTPVASHPRAVAPSPNHPSFPGRRSDPPPHLRVTGGRVAARPDG